ncbi:MAG: replication initiation protein [Clostridium sp.]|uniref:replication initiation protein n=1 Tax=Clostridium sp. TaxID=1506 RepID=UPI0025BB9D05|nr:replication initiation protein [Clostridium sp.]MCE5222280.1 replication initiation protein [Clostridium sp.]
MITDLQNINNNWIYQSNKLIEASYTLTVIEQKIIRLLASMIKKDDDDFKEYEFKTKDLIKILNTSDSRFYRDIDNITDLIMQRIIKIKDVNTGEFEKYHWIDVCKYKNGILKLKINRELKPFYLSLDWYTKYQLKNIMQFKSTYSFRLYELLKQYEKISNRLITIDNLRAVLDIDKTQYPKYANLKQKVINVAVKEVNLKTDIDFTLEEIKTGRKVTSIKFNIKKKKNVQNEISTIKEDSKKDININNIKLVQAIIENISDIDASKIFDVACGDIENIKEKYSIISKFKNVKNLTGAMIQAIRENWTTNTINNNNFNNFETRTYDYDELEKKLLGWE